MAEYIERKELRETYEKWRNDLARSGNEYGCGLMEDVLFELDAQSTVAIEPVVHGRWDGNDCTVCKLPWNYNMVQDADDWGYFDPMPDYCPNCGAKMGGDEE